MNGGIMRYEAYGNTQLLSGLDQTQLINNTRGDIGSGASFPTEWPSERVACAGDLTFRK
jgi:hypothetical protein